MKWLKLLIPAAILAFTMHLTSCQSIGFPSGSNETEWLRKTDVAKMFPPILISENDRLTYGTSCQILETNVTFWCAFPELAPKAFPRELCQPGVPVCRTILGSPETPSPPPPAPTGI